MAKPPTPVEVRFDVNKKITVSPYKARIFRDQQKIVWTLVTERAGATFTPVTGILIKKAGAAAGFKNWPGRQAAPVGTPMTYRADGDHPNNTEAVILYQYDIGVTYEGIEYVVRHGNAGNDDRSAAMRYDPDISNEPQP
jgi:hypothetical protein